MNSNANPIASTSSVILTPPEPEIVQETKDPKDALVIKNTLMDMGIEDYEPKVVSQLLEFIYRYATSIAEDAKMFSTHAKKKLIDPDDVRLAIQMYNEQNHSSPPSRDVLLEMARSKNATTLKMPTSSGVRLPPDRFCVTGCNYRLKKQNKSQRGSFQGNVNRNTNIATVRTVAPRIQITPNAPGSTFTMTVNPQFTQKRKADEMMK